MSFHHAPVTKGLMITLALSSLSFALLDIKYYLHLQLIPHLWRDHQYWRLLIHPLAFANSGDLLIGESVLFYIGAGIERAFGSEKFASFILTTSLLSTLLSLLSLLLFHSLGLTTLPSGPYSLLFALLYQHHRLTPSLYTFRIFGLSLSNKSLHYLLPLQLFLSQPPGSAVACLIGLLVGQLYRTDILGLKTYRLSPVLVRLSSRFLLPLLGSTRPPRRTTSIGDEPPSRRSSGGVASAVGSLTAGLGLPTLRPPPSPSPANPSPPGTNPGSPTTPAPVRQSTPTPAEQAPSFRSLVQELRGQGTTLGLRAPGEAEIALVGSMFPNLRREEVVGALQRSDTTERAVEILLASSQT